MGSASDAFQVHSVRHVTSGQNIADCLSRLTKIPASPRGVTEEYVRMVPDNATQRAINTREIERASAEDEELSLLEDGGLVREIRTKMPEFEGDEEEERSGTTDQQA